MAAAEKHKIPWIGVTIAVEAPFNAGYKWTFGAFSMSSDQVRSYFDLLDSIWKDLIRIKIAHLELQDDWGKECGAYLRQTAKERGYVVVVDSKYASSSNDFSSLILQMRSTGADTLFSVATPPQSMLIVRQMKELNYAPKLTLLNNWPGLTTYWTSMGKDANYIMSDGNWDETMPYPGNKKLVDDYNAAYPGMESIGIPVGSATRPPRYWPM